MYEYFGVNAEFLNDDNVLAFVQENVDREINAEDVELYAEILTDLVDGTRAKSLTVKNKPSVISIIAFACINDMDLDGCLAELLASTSLSGNQTENYINMKKRLEELSDVA